MLGGGRDEACVRVVVIHVPMFRSPRAPWECHKVHAPHLSTHRPTARSERERAGSGKSYVCRAGRGGLGRSTDFVFSCSLEKHKIIFRLKRYHMKNRIATQTKLVTFCTAKGNICNKTKQNKGEHEVICAAEQNTHTHNQ